MLGTEIRFFQTFNLPLADRLTDAIKKINDQIVTIAKASIL
jgi:hypothetical protein